MVSHAGVGRRSLQAMTKVGGEVAGLELELESRRGVGDAHVIGTPMMPLVSKFGWGRCRRGLHQERYAMADIMYRQVNRCEAVR